MNVTLDTNCIIDLEENTSVAPYLRMLLDLHEDQIILRVVAIGVSERRTDGIYASDLTEFRERITAVGLSGVEILKPICYDGITFGDWCVVPSNWMVELERKIQNLLFPDIELSYESFTMKHSLDPNNVEVYWRWMNAKSDVLSLWSHIWYGGGIFVTMNDELYNWSKKMALYNLGAGYIERPEEAIMRLISR